MKSWLLSFNTYLLAAALLGGGCGSNRLSADKQYATVSVFLEGRLTQSVPVRIGPEKATVYIVPDPVVTEADLARASLVDNPDGTYAIQLNFDEHGKLVLDMQTTSNPGRHLVVFAKFPPKGWKAPADAKVGATPGDEQPQPGQPRMSAWLAAPMIPRNGISNGLLRFAPDASRAEVGQIVEGLNNFVKALNKGDD
jgi:hypothetical protein